MSWMQFDSDAVDDIHCLIALEFWKQFGWIFWWLNNIICLDLFNSN